MPRHPTPASAHAFWPWAAGGALTGLLLALLLFAPARWLAATVAQATQGRVLLSHTQGTVWSGSARLTLAAGPDSHDAANLPGRVSWRLRPGWGQGSLTLDAPCCTPEPLHIRLAPNGQGLRLTLADGPSHWPAALLSGLGTPWNTVQLQGRLTVSGQALAVQLTPRHLTFEGRLQIDAIDLSSRLSTVRPMGSYRLLLRGGTTPTLELTTLRGSLLLNGQGQWVGAHLHFAGEASAAPEHVDEFANLLNIIGRRDGVRSIITLG